MKRNVLASAGSVVLTVVLSVSTCLAQQAASAPATENVAIHTRIRQAAVAGLSSLPLAAQSGISATLGRDLPAYQARAECGGFQVENAQRKSTLAIGAAGLRIW
jgi:hypothetical protein